MDSWIKSMLIAILIAVIVRMFIVEVNVVGGESMLPTLGEGERVLVSKVDYLVGEPDKRDIVVFEALEGRRFIKRIVAEEGETVKIDEGYLKINDEYVKECYIDNNVDFEEKEVPSNSYFILGDNRYKSLDSRTEEMGAIKEDKIKGRAVIVIWPLQDIRILE